MPSQKYVERLAAVGPPCQAAAGGCAGGVWAYFPTKLELTRYETRLRPPMPTPTELYDQADKLKDQGKLEEAIALLHQALELDPNFALAHSALAVYYGRLGRHEEAIRHGLKVVELEPNDPFSYTAMSVTFQRAGRIPEAEEFKARAHMVGMHRH